MELNDAYERKGRAFTYAEGEFTKNHGIWRMYLNCIDGSRKRKRMTKTPGIRCAETGNEGKRDAQRRLHMCGTSSHHRSRSPVDRACTTGAVTTSTATTEALRLRQPLAGVFRSPEAFSHEWRAFVSITGIRGTQGMPPMLHDCRHTYATLAVADQVIDIMSLSSILGHKDTRMTLTVYSDALLSAKRRGVDAMDETLQGTADTNLTDRSA